MDKLIQGTRRERVDVDELRRLKEAGAVYLDPRRSRPLWFDGRFLKAHDLNREQNYFLTRQADLAVATGTGVIQGLEVAAGQTAAAIVIGRGHGVTHGGERVLLPRDQVVDLANIPMIQRLNVALGLSRIPAPPLRSRSGQEHVVHYLSLPCSPCMFVHNNKVVSCWFAHARCVSEIGASAIYADVARLLARDASETRRTPLLLVDS